MRIDDNRSLDADAIELMGLDTMSTANDFVHRVTEDRDGREWLLTDQCVLLYGSKLRLAGRHEYLKQLGQRVFMGTPDGRLDYWQQGQKTLTPVTLPATPTAITCMETLETSGDSLLLVGTDRGLMAVDSKARARLLCEESVKNMLIDSRKRVWIVHGSSQSDAAKPSTQFMVEGLALTPSGDVHTVHRSQIAVIPSTLHPLILLEDSQRTLWAVTGTHTAYYYDEPKGIFVKGGVSGTQPQEQSPQIVKYFIDSQHNLWFSSTRDLSVMRFRHHNLSFISLAS